MRQPKKRLKNKKKLTQIQEKVVSEVCQRLKQGQTLRRIFYFRDGEHLPPLTTFLDWYKNNPEIRMAVGEIEI